MTKIETISANQIYAEIWEYRILGFDILLSIFLNKNIDTDTYIDIAQAYKRPKSGLQNGLTFLCMSSSN
jgi:hypothetical protein